MTQALPEEVARTLKVSELQVQSASWLWDLEVVGTSTRNSGVHIAGRGDI